MNSIRHQEGSCWFCGQTNGPLFKSDVLKSFIHLECLENDCSELKKEGHDKQSVEAEFLAPT